MSLDGNQKTQKGEWENFGGPGKGHMWPLEDLEGSVWATRGPEKGSGSRWGPWEGQGRTWKGR